jgi:hypothetical protein
MLSVLSLGAEIVLAYSAERTYEIIGNIFPLSTCRHSVIGCALSWVIDIAANVTYVFHRNTSLIKFL